MSRRETAIRSRPATQDDLALLWDFLAIAAYEPDIDAAKAVPFVAAHLAGWRWPEDFGFIAELDGVAIGAAWARQFSTPAPTLHHLSDPGRCLLVARLACFRTGGKQLPVPLGDDFDAAVDHFYGGLIVDRVRRH